MASTRVLLIAIPTALTPCPNMIAPKPHANPIVQVIAIVQAGTAPSTRKRSGTVPRAITRGISTQETRMKIAHTFSQAYRPRYFMGRAKSPHMTPATTAQPTPDANVEVKTIIPDPHKTQSCLYRISGRQVQL